MAQKPDKIPRLRAYRLYPCFDLRFGFYGAKQYGSLFPFAAGARRSSTCVLAERQGGISERSDSRVTRHAD